MNMPKKSIKLDLPSDGHTWDIPAIKKAAQEVLEHEETDHLRGVTKKDASDIIEGPEKTLTCSVCHQPITGACGTCLCLPSHGSWHYECDPHNPDTNTRTREKKEEPTEWWDAEASDVAANRGFGIAKLCAWVEAESRRRTLEEAIERLRLEISPRTDKFGIAIVNATLREAIIRLESMKNL